MIGRRRMAIGWATLACLVLLWFALTTWTGTVSAGRFPSPADFWFSLIQVTTPPLRRRIGIGKFVMRTTGWKAGGGQCRQPHPLVGRTGKETGILRGHSGAVTALYALNDGGLRRALRT